MVFLHWAFRQGLKRSVDNWVVGLYGSQRPGVSAQESTGKGIGSSTIAFIPNSVRVTPKSPSLRERVRTVVLSGMASAASTRNSGDLNCPTPGRPFYVRVIPSAKYLIVLRVSLKTDEFASFLYGPFPSIGPQFPRRKSLSNSYSIWNLAEAYSAVFAESWVPFSAILSGPTTDYHRSYRHFPCSTVATNGQFTW